MSKVKIYFNFLGIFKEVHQVIQFTLLVRSVCAAEAEVCESEHMPFMNKTFSKEIMKKKLSFAISF